MLVFWAGLGVIIWKIFTVLFFIASFFSVGYLVGWGVESVLRYFKVAEWLWGNEDKHEVFPRRTIVGIATILVSSVAWAIIMYNGCQVIKGCQW